MADKDLITEQILSIEDFDNVDAELMRMIESDNEYRRIFEEYKEISALTSECVPEPAKNGVSLHDAVMGRVRSGDTAPRYLFTNTGRRFMFPVATAASLVIVLAAAVTATVMTKTVNKNAADEQIADNGYVSEYSQKSRAEMFAPAPKDAKTASGREEYFDEDTADFGFEVAEEEFADSVNGAGVDDGASGIVNGGLKYESEEYAYYKASVENDVVSEERNDVDNYREEVSDKTEAPETGSGSSVYIQKDILKKGNDAVANDDQELYDCDTYSAPLEDKDIYVEGVAFETTLANDNELSSVKVEHSGTEQSGAVDTSKSEGTQAADPSVTVDAAGEEYDVELEDAENLSSAVAERLEKAVRHSGYNGEKISLELIEAYGEELFIAWFDSIIDSPDFGTLYTADEYISYCVMNGAD